MLEVNEHSVLSGVPGAVLAVDAAGTVVYSSAEADALLQVVGLVGRPLTTIIPPRLRTAHEAGFARYRDSGVSNLGGKTVRVPALLGNGHEQEIDLTIRFFVRPDETKVAVAALEIAALGRPPSGLLRIERNLVARAYELL